MKKNGYEAVKNLDLTKWQHDLFRLNDMPYDPYEIEVIKKYCRMADQKFEDNKLYRPDYFM